MRLTRILIALIGLLPVGLLPAHRVCADGMDLSGTPRVRTQTFDVTYAVNAAATPLDRVELWHRVPGAADWSLYGEDADLVSPMTYATDQEGVHDLFFVLTNAAGTSGSTPEADTTPHLSVFVDYTLPLLQLQRADIKANAPGQSVVRFEWSAIDSHLSARPIRITHRLVPDGDWKDVHAHLPNTGLYEWKIPADLRGRVQFRISVTDQAGNYSFADSAELEITGAPDPTGQGLPPVGRRPVQRVPLPGARLSADQMHRLNQLLKTGAGLQDEHNDAGAIVKFREALAIDPQHPDALVNLGQSLYALGQYDDAAEAFRKVLSQSPQQPTALLGLAETLIETEQFDEAKTNLLSLVASGRHDDAAWLRLGDVAAYKGQTLSARDYYLKAAGANSSATDINALAKRRLDELLRNAKTPAIQGNRENQPN